MAESNEKPLVSVIIPTYNRAEPLQEALKSVYSQEGEGDLFEMEIIVIDDASSDSTLEVMRQHPRVRYMRFDKNRGASAARNAGIRASTGKYVAFLDDDDLWLSHRLRDQVPVLETQPEIGLVYGQISISGDGVMDVWPNSAPSGVVFNELLTLTDDFMSPDTILVRREAFDTAGYFDENLPTMEHYDMYLRLAFHIPFLFIQGPVAHGRFSKSGKWSTNVKNGNNERVLPVIIERALAMLPENTSTEHLRRKARIAVFSTIAGQRWYSGEVSLVRDHLLDSLRKYPWMFEEQPFLQTFRHVAYKVAADSDAPFATVRALSAQVGAAKGKWKLKEKIRTRQVLSSGLADVAVGLMKAGCYRRSGYAAIAATFYNPIQLTKFPLRAASAGMRLMLAYINAELAEIIALLFER